MARAQAADGVPVVWVSHDLAQVNRLADYVVVVVAGSILHTGPARAVESLRVCAIGDHDRDRRIEPSFCNGVDERLEVRAPA